MEVNPSVYRVASCAWHIADDDAILTDQFVEEGGLANVGPTNECDFDGFIDRCGSRWRDGANNRIKQVAGAVSLQGADRVNITKSQLIKLDTVGARVCGFTLICRDDHRWDRFAKALTQANLFTHNVGDGVIGARQSSLTIDCEDNHIGFRNGDLHLLADLTNEVGGPFRERYCVCASKRFERFKTAGINKSEFDPAPFRAGMHAVTGSAGSVIDNRKPFADETVK